MFKSSRLLAFLLAGALFAGIAGCDSNGGVIDDDDNGDDFAATYDVALSGDQEVPPVETEASGSSTIEVNEDATELVYSLTVTDIDSVFAAHIHLGGPDTTGSVVAPFFTDDTTGVITGDTLLAEGTITAADLVGPLEGMDLSVLADSMAAGQAYVNVHTLANPAGEIRGQIGPTQ